MNELELIKSLTAGLPSNEQTVLGAGDDCAILDLGSPEQDHLFKTDAIVETVHFLESAEPERIGHKALGRAMSDIAAMGGYPVSAVVTIGLPSPADTERARAIYDGLSSLAARFHTSISGGETVRSQEGLWISVAIIGSVGKGRAIRRRGSAPGDVLMVTGELGGSLDGKHLDFTPRLAEAQWIAEHGFARSMIDLSDGLATDLRHLLKPDDLGCDLLKASIPVSRAATARAREGRGDPAPVAALSDGEDYELLFTAQASRAVEIVDAWKSRFPETRLTVIGRLSQEPGLRFHTEEGFRILREHGYDHFRKPGED